MTPSAPRTAAERRPDPGSIRRILIIKLRAVGDVVLSTIVIDNLRRAFPAAAIDFLTEEASRQVVSGHPQLDEVVVLERKAIARLGAAARLAAHRDFLHRIRAARYDLVFDFFGNPRSALLTWWSGAAWRIGYDYRVRRNAYTVVVPSRAATVHEAEWHLDALSRLGIPVVSHHLSFAMSPEAVDKAARFWREAGLEGAPVLALNFSGGWVAKRWPLARFAELAGRLVPLYRARILVIWGPGELEQAQQLAALAPVPVTLIPAADLKELAALLQRVDLMISTDSGPMHIAAAVGTPCVGLFGPTNPHLQGPYGPGHQIVTVPGLGCLGCNRTACDHIRCMAELSVGQVLDGVARAAAALPVLRKE
ncbi:MAG TPA: glycosyltransferase family 9 protein [bacterium]|nr:glycosyltransferase family 9 protein [bacterium]HPR88168.1 glycosyltransferase family 9 protein [bacterium]